MKNKSGIIHIIPLVLIGIVISVVAYYAYALMPTFTEKYPAPLPSEVAEMLKEDEEKDNLESFRSESYGITFKYPTVDYSDSHKREISVEEQKENNRIAVGIPDTEIVYFFVYRFSRDEFEAFEFYEDFNKLPTKTINNIDFKIKKVEIKGCDTCYYSKDITEVFLYKENRGSVYTIFIPVDSNMPYTILSTFEFID